MAATPQRSLDSISPACVHFLVLTLIPLIPFSQSALTLLALIYFLTSTGPSPTTRKLPWLVFGQLCLDAFLFVLWLAATAASNYDCNGLCSACSPIEEGDRYWVWAGSLLCECYAGIVLAQNKARRDLKGQAVSSATRSAARTMERSDKIAAKQGLDAVMIFLFASTMAVTAWRVYQARQAASGLTTHGPAMEIPHQTDDKSKDGTDNEKPVDPPSEEVVSEVQ